MKLTSTVENNNDNNDCIERCNLRFFLIASLHCGLSPTHMLKWPGRNCVQIMCNLSGAHQVQHVVCHMVWRDSSAKKFDKVEIAYILASFYWLKQLTNEGGEEPENQKKTPDDKLEKNASY